MEPRIFWAFLLSLNILMSYAIRCYTLFDITATGVLNRGKPPLDMSPQVWAHKRNTQCNYDTVLQAVSIRSQPEVLSSPQRNTVLLQDIKHFGQHYKQKTPVSCWHFDFSVQHGSVFENENGPLGSLYSDCDGIPMILVGSECSKLESLLRTDARYKNIHFELL